jgi:recombination associated protein RdgC
MFFRNLKVLRLDPSWNYSAAQLAELCRRAVLIPPGANDTHSVGWMEPRGQEDELVVDVNGQQLLAFGSGTKLLPGSIVRQHLAAALKTLETQQGFRPGRLQTRELRERVIFELLPKAFVRYQRTFVWIDPRNRWMGVDASTPARADMVLEQLKRTLDALPLQLLRTTVSPSSAMTAWLSSGEAPAGFTIDRDCELVSRTEDHAGVKFTRHTLDAENVVPHLATGKVATRLALTWNDRISFVLGEDMQIRRLAFLDLLQEQAEQQAGEGEQELFVADFSIMTGELAKLLADLVSALGGAENG